MINIRYAQIRECDVSNGDGVGVALFVQGCNFHCFNCFNKDTWDFNGGKEWTPEVEDKFIELASRPYIKRISLLGGECLADENLDGVLNLVNKIRLLMPEKTIWLYTGYEIKLSNLTYIDASDDYTIKKQYLFCTTQSSKNAVLNIKRQNILSSVDVVIDGRYIDSQRNISAKWKGSDNQRVIDIKKSLREGRLTLWCE